MNNITNNSSKGVVTFRDSFHTTLNNLHLLSGFYKNTFLPRQIQKSSIHWICSMTPLRGQEKTWVNPAAVANAAMWVPLLAGWFLPPPEHDYFSFSLYIGLLVGCFFAMAYVYLQFICKKVIKVSYISYQTRIIDLFCAYT